MKKMIYLPLAGYCTLASAAERPNIIYIFTDQQTAMAMSCAGNTDVHTPNLDRLAAAGIRFSNAYCTAPLSGPSRGAMFTGHYPESVGLSVNNTPMPDSLKSCTLGTLVKEAGYECAYGGKWHIPELDIPNERYGFKRIFHHSDLGLAEACVEFLNSPHTRPFFLVAAFDNPHNICEYARSQNLPYGNIEEPELKACPGLPANFARNPYDADILLKEQNDHFGIYPTIHYTKDDWRKYRYTYYKLVEKVDQEIGKILDAIDRNHLWKNTIVIFSSDHGDGNGAHQWNQKSALYEEVIRVPLIVTLPGRKQAGKVLPQLISNGVDFFATICDWTGVKQPQGTTGTSFRTIAEKADTQIAHQPFIVIETQFDGSQTRGWALRTAEYKYIIYDQGRYREQLYHLESDPGEMRNLAVEETYQEQLVQHRRILDDWMKKHQIRQTRFAVRDIPTF